MSQKDYELLIYNQFKNLEKVRREVEKLPNTVGLWYDIRSLENDLRIKFGNNRKLDYLLSLK